ncbi:MAG: ABC transporter ATP-binding protein [bacterium]
MLRILKFLKPYLPLLLILIVFTSLQVWVNLQLPDYLARIINDGVVKEDQNQIMTLGLSMLGIALVGGICTVIAGFLSSRIGMGFTKDLRSALFTKIESFSLSEFNKYSTSSLITRSTNDVQQLQTVVIMILRMVLAAPITAVIAIGKAYNTAPSMTWILVVAVIALLSVIGAIFYLAVPKFVLLQKLIDRLNLVVRESLNGIRVIRAFNNQKIEEKKLEVVNSDITRTTLFVNRVISLLQPSMFLIMNLAAIGIIWFGAHLIQTNDLGIGNMLAFMQYSLQVIIAFLMISIVFIMVPRAKVSVTRIAEVLSTKLIVTDPEKETKIEESNKGKVEFRNVNFGYSHADEKVLENISFTAEAGKITAFIGSTGSGKSTLISLIPRFYDVTEGEILVDDVDIRKLKQEELHNLIGYVPQKAVLFSGTIKDNIKYGSEGATDEQVIEATNIAQATDFINSLEKKFDTLVSQDGTNFSGGQKQRLAISRAIVKNPQIFIFDDSFSALDFKTDAALRHALFEKAKGKTLLIVAQRINTIIDADQIVVLDEGKVVGIGKHKDLMKSCGVYKEIVDSQLSEKEISNSLK